MTDNYSNGASILDNQPAAPAAEKVSTRGFWQHPVTKNASLVLGLAASFAAGWYVRRYLVQNVQYVDVVDRGASKKTAAEAAA